MNINYFDFTLRLKDKTQALRSPQPFGRLIGDHNWRGDTVDLGKCVFLSVFEVVTIGAIFSFLTAWLIEQAAQSQFQLTAAGGVFTAI